MDLQEILGDWGLIILLPLGETIDAAWRLIRSPDHVLTGSAVYCWWPLRSNAFDLVMSL